MICKDGICVYLGCHHVDSLAHSLRQLLCPLAKAELMGIGFTQIQETARQRYGYDLKTFSKI